ncbi:hypothetical protein SDC9_120763 [bioreactor metagenome]|uniref:Uncharacterized protein n=1 Tax=bioreactor metagenome TaxID=1076179 RepID=A0A645CA44_9ZZZZ
MYPLWGLHGSMPAALHIRLVGYAGFEREKGTFPITAIWHAAYGLSPGVACPRVVPVQAPDAFDDLLFADVEGTMVFDVLLQLLHHHFVPLVQQQRFRMCSQKTGKACQKARCGEISSRDV